MYIGVSVCACARACVYNLMLRTACECCGMLHLASSGFPPVLSEEPHELVGLETVPIPLERQPRNVKCPVSISAFCSCHTNLNE